MWTDTIIGDANQNRLSGYNGNDTIKGGDNPSALLIGGYWPGETTHGKAGDDMRWGGLGPGGEGVGRAERRRARRALRPVAPGWRQRRGREHS